MCSSFPSLSPLSTETSEGEHAIEVEREEQNGQSAVSREKDTALNLLLAGRDTTNTALTWFFYVISHHPEVEKKILDELKPISEAHTFEENLTVFKVEELKSTIDLNAALHEALRLFPPVSLEHKSPTTAEVLPTGHKVEPAMKILVNLYAMARIEGIWGKDCREYKPELPAMIQEAGFLLATAPSRRRIPPTSLPLPLADPPSRRRSLSSPLPSYILSPCRISFNLAASGTDFLFCPVLTWQRRGFCVQSAVAVTSTSLPALRDRSVGVQPPLLVKHWGGGSCFQTLGWKGDKTQTLGVSGLFSLL